MSAGNVTVKTSFKLTEGGIIAELNHQEDGLARGTVLISENDGQTWKVQSRIVFAHTEPKQRDFESEERETMFPSFSSTKKRLASTRQILEKEAAGTYMYLIMALSHENTPTDGEILNLDATNVELPEYESADEEE